MNKRIILIIGLCGSGKTTLAKTIDNSVLIDDPKSFDEISKYKNDDIENIVITDAKLCIESTKKAAIKILNEIFPDRIIDIICFENDLKKATKNIEKRNDGRVVFNFNKYLSQIYIPEGKIIKIP